MGRDLDQLAQMTPSVGQTIGIIAQPHFMDGGRDGYGRMRSKMQLAAAMEKAMMIWSGVSKNSAVQHDLPI